MQKCMSDYLDSVCAEIRRKGVRDAARAELTDHLTTHRDMLVSQGMDEETASKKAVQTMGNPCALGIKIAAANKAPASIIILLTGLGLAVFTGWLMVLWGGGNYPVFLDLPTLVCVAGLSAAYGLLRSGGRPTLLLFFREIKTGAIYAGVLGMITGLIILLGNISDPKSSGAGVAMALISALYGVLFSAGARIVEGWLTAPALDAITAVHQTNE